MNARRNDRFANIRTSNAHAGLSVQNSVPLVLGRPEVVQVQRYLWGVEGLSVPEDASCAIENKEQGMKTDTSISLLGEAGVQGSVECAVHFFRGHIFPGSLSCAPPTLLLQKSH